jgi:SdpC family antimicrobial peptide
VRAPRPSRRRSVDRPTSLRSAADALQKLDGNQKIAADIERVAGSLSSDSGPALAASIKDAIRLFDYDTIINRIGNRDPSFFGRFQTEIRSGNQLRVNAIYKEGRDKLVAAFEEGTSGEANALAPKWCEYCYVETIFFVFAVGAAFAVVVITVPPLQSVESNSDLQNQMNVDTITQQLAL